MFYCGIFTNTMKAYTMPAGRRLCASSGLRLHISAPRRPEQEDDVGAELGRDVGAELLLLELDDEEDDVGAELGRDIIAELLLHELDEKDDVGEELGRDVRAKLLLLEFHEEDDVEVELGRDGGYIRAEHGAQA
jgi:hypothetical protein